MSEDHPEAITLHRVWQLTRGQYLSLVGDYSSEHDGWGVEMMIYTRHTPIISDGFLEATLSTLGHTPPVDDVFFRDDALRWGIVSSFLLVDYDRLAVVGWPYTRGVVVSESAFIGDTVTLLIDGWFLRSRFILRHSPPIGDGLWFILEHSHFRWFILGHNQFIRTHRAQRFWFIWIMLRCFHF